MKLPSLFPVVCFAGGILLSGTLANRVHVPPANCILLLPRSFCFWHSFCCAGDGFSLQRFSERQRGCAWALRLRTWSELPSLPNLASTLIETGKLDGSAALRWRGRLRSDPLDLPWGTRYEIALEEVESSAGVTPVTGGLRLTSYRDESKSDSPPPARAGDRSRMSCARPPRPQLWQSWQFRLSRLPCAPERGIARHAAKRPVADDSRPSSIDGCPARLARARGRLL